MKLESILKEEIPSPLFFEGIESTAPQRIKGEKEIVRLLEKSPIPFDRRFELKTEAYMLQLAYANNKLLSLSNSRTRILPHQIESTYRIVNSLNQRFLIADEVGLGKTIEAGLVIKELLYRHSYNRILIVCPASLRVQWKYEMQSKFNEDFLVLDRKELLKRNKLQDEEYSNSWNSFNKVICSLDFIKNSSFTDVIKNTQWDTIIIDECHRLRRDYKKSTLAYDVGEILAKKSKAFLIMSATPFRGKLEELYYLIKLIDPNLLGPINSFHKEFSSNEADLSLLKEKLASVVIRRTKKEVGGFTKRYAKTIKFEFYPEERTLYDATTKYVIEEFNRSLQLENRAIGFVMTVFQKLLDSSSFALLSALRKRKINLLSIQEKVNNNINSFSEGQENIILDDLDINELEDFDLILNIVNQKNLSEIQEEINTIDRLICIAESITRNKKGEKLKEILKDLSKHGTKKFLIFTQFIKTQEYLKNLLSDYVVEIFNGSMDRDQKERAILNFKEKAEILISTESGGEGRNLQFVNILFNFDLPWSPLRIEQRIGRIHRFGQPSDVFVYNFSTKDTVAERILEVLSEKLKLFEQSIGTPDVLLGQIEDELNLNSLFMKMIMRKKSNPKIDKEIDKKIDDAKKSYEKLSGLMLSQRMDLNYDEYYKITLKERQFSNKRIERYVNRLRTVDEYVDRFLGKEHKRNHLYYVKKIPSESIKSRMFGTFNSQVALENENLEFLAFGHPIIDSLIEYIKGKDFDGLTGIKVINFRKKLICMVFNYLVRFKSKTIIEEFIPVIVDPSNSLNNDELEDVERESTEQEIVTPMKIDELKENIFLIVNDVKKHSKKARERIMKKADIRLDNIKENLDLQIDTEMEKINDSYRKRITELEEQLDRQESHQKWFEKDMRGAITRTKNRILMVKKEKEKLLSQYKRYMGSSYSIELINAGIIVSNPIG